MLYPLSYGGKGGENAYRIAGGRPQAAVNLTQQLAADEQVRGAGGEQHGDGHSRRGHGGETASQPH